MLVDHHKTLTFDDVLLMPQFSDLESRTEADISTKLGTIDLKVPVVSANMDTITGVLMAEVMRDAGGLGILHRYMKPEQVLSALNAMKHFKIVAVPSIGVQIEDGELAMQYRQLTDHICIDIAHGDSQLMVDMVEHCKRLDFKTIIAGNVVTETGAIRLAKAGANVIKVGVGPGSVCTTRLVTGHGMPQLTAIIEARAALNECGHRQVAVLADGGLKTSGDIVKALAGGAAAVMTGSLFAGCDECERPGEYRGMASAEAQLEVRGKINNDTAEGVTLEEVPARGSAIEVMKQLAGGIRSGLSYSGSRNIKELQENAIFRVVSGNTLIENGPRNL